MTARVDHHSLRFGVEVETTGASRTRLASSIAAALRESWNEKHPDQPRDGTAYVADSGGVWEPCASDRSSWPGHTIRYVGSARTACRLWGFHNDGSVNGNATEIVTPALCGDDDVDALQTVVRAAKAGGATVDESCGVHVHVDGALLRQQPAAIVRLVHSWRRYEDLIGLAIDLLPERRAMYCCPVDGNQRGHNGAKFLARLAQLSKTPSFVDVRRAWYGPDDDGDGHYHNSRYHALNLHSLLAPHGAHGTVEFRCFNGTLHAGKVRAYVQLCRCVVAHALNATSVSKERRAFDVNWTRYAIYGLLKNLGMKGDEFATAREHLIALGKGVACFKNAADYRAWQVRHGRIPGEGPRASEAITATSEPYDYGEQLGPRRQPRDTDAAYVLNEETNRMESRVPLGPVAPTCGACLGTHVAHAADCERWRNDDDAFYASLAASDAFDVGADGLPIDDTDAAQ